MDIHHEIVIPIPQSLIDQLAEEIAGKVVTRLNEQRFLVVHATVYNLFNLGWHLVSAEHYRNLRAGAFGHWALAVA